MGEKPIGAASDKDAATEIRTFLIADVRGYTLFTQERGDEAAGKLAKRFAELAREGVESRGGAVIELRGDEALAVFGSPRQAIRAAVDLQARFVEETIADPSLPFPVGIGIDAGEAVAVEGGYRGGALNLAARLCGHAGPGEILASQEAVHMARKVEGVIYVDRGLVQMKGIAEPVHVVRVVSEDGDPATLLKPYVQVPTPRRRRRRSALIGVALASMVAVVAVLFPVVERGRGQAGFAPGMVLLDAENFRSLGVIPPSTVKTPAQAIYADGHFWVLNLEPISFVEIEPKTGAVINQITSPFDDVGYYAVDGNTLWVTEYDKPYLSKIDIDLSREVDRFPISQGPDDQGGSLGVVVADGSVWVGRKDRCEALRLDPQTGELQRRFDTCGSYGLAYGDGSVWGVGSAGVTRIDPKTNTPTETKVRGSGGNVAAGGGFGWTSHETKGLVYKIDQTGNLAASYNTGTDAGPVSFSDGVLWVGNRDDGTVTAIDGVTGQMRSYHFGHPLQSLAAGSGVVLVQLNQGLTYEDKINALKGTVVKLLVHPFQLEQLDPALQYNWLGFQVEYATCAGLLRYPDSDGASGAQLQPEVAASMPALSADRRTYTFTVGRGYAFSPPSNEAVTAETFRYSIERALSPKLGDPTPGAQLVDDIEGEAAYMAGKADHIKGLRAHGDSLSITLTAPAPDFLARLALPYFCPVPAHTAFVAGGVVRHVPGPAREEMVPSDGPYYVSDHFNGEYIILQRNPNYTGPRPHALDAIALREGIDPGEAVARVESGGWDGIMNLYDSLFDPTGALALKWGPGSASAQKGDQRYYPVPISGVDALAFNASRKPFSDPTIRRAAALALDRPSLAAAFAESPSAQLLPPNQPGYLDGADPYPLDGADLAKAHALMRGRRVRATLASYASCDECDQWAKALQSQLAAIGISVRIQRLADPANAIRKPSATFDLYNAFDNQDFADPATFLTMMFGQDVPDSWLPASVRNDLDGVLSLTGEARDAAAAPLAARLAADELPATGFAYPVNGQFFSTRIGCRVFPPFGYGIDLAAMCVKGT